jgi:rsbT co-antagonist protein RsbR
VASTLVSLLEQHGSAILQEWIAAQLQVSSRSGAISKGDLQAQCTEFFSVFHQALKSGATTDIGMPVWSAVREQLANVSRTRATRGFTPSETALFVFSLKAPLFERMRENVADKNVLLDATWAVTEILDALGLYTTEVYQKGRDEVIRRQQEDMLELSTPVVNLWDGILALPIIGTLDSARTQVVMETLLQRIVDTEADVAIIDITGVPTVDTLTAQHLLKTVTAARLMGADCIISGIRPQIAQTIVHLGVDLGDIVTKATLADAFRIALQRTGAALGAKRHDRSGLRSDTPR